MGSGESGGTAAAGTAAGGATAGGAVPGLPDGLDDVAKALDRPELFPPAAADQLRAAVAAAVDHIFLGAAVAALVALLILLLAAPRRFPVLPED
ncbi:hypothetical protein [Streptomyces sp. H27-S2]|uniref:hypothetical protein n=1 Tax=Streptomyces antarcticus TaxID=2996458 RepID=UPI0022706E10|nr:hypothetical protein [Streptomyces sp. H27-S2]MCY0951858.1 hypothetical protein [Streptomyces sp. H27-S2]